MVGAEPAQLAFALADLAVELVDQSQARFDRSLPWLRQTESHEQRAAADTEEIGDRARLPVRQQDRVHALLQARAVAHQVQAPARAFALGAHAGVREPDRRHQVAASPGRPFFMAFLYHGSSRDRTAHVPRLVSGELASSRLTSPDHAFASRESRPNSGPAATFAVTLPIRPGGC